MERKIIFKKVVYISPDYSSEGYDIEFFEQMPTEELLTFAQNSNFAQVYSLKGFERAFNAEEISDLGYIFFV